MEEVDDVDENEFNQEEIEDIIQESIEKVLENQKFDETKVQQWINDICERVMTGLNKLCKAYKYVCNCLIQQKIDAGFHTTATCVWESLSDGLVTVQYPKGRAKEPPLQGIQCICTVFCVKF
ncbi:unnamed protein product [Moneuplotes crassus]|uniref:Dynein light chain n=1 Tax=Euplotes crassus TaxID=5936 RepID=A0AAD1Y3V0_EUPCR|nr:unnamed protein product [Moneuplotes crassus]